VESESKDLIRLVGIVREISIAMDCTKISSAVPFEENLFSCPLPTLQSEVPDVVQKLEPRSQKVKSDSESSHSQKLKSDSESSDSDSSELQQMPTDISTCDEDQEKDLPDEIWKAIKSAAPLIEKKPNAVDLEDELCSELAEMHTAAAKELEVTTSLPKTQNWRQNNNSPRYNNHKSSPSRSQTFSSPYSSPRKDFSPRMEHSPTSPRREYSPYSPRNFNVMSPKRDFSLNSSQHSTPRKEYGSPEFKHFSAEKFVHSFAKYSEEPKSPDFIKRPEQSYVNPKVYSPAQQLHYQQLFESALSDLRNDLRTYQPPKVDKILGYDELEVLSKQFNPSSVCNPAFERREPYFNRKAVLLGMSKHLGVLCNICKRFFVFNGGVKGYLQKLADGYEPNEADIPTWIPGEEGYKVVFLILFLIILPCVIFYL